MKAKYCFLSAVLFLLLANAAFAEDAASGGAAVAAATVAAGPSAPVGEDGFVPLFDGKTLDGWKMVDGDAVFRVEDGCIVAEIGSGKGAFLRTEKADYRDFILKLEVKLVAPCNSGVQFRSHEREGDGRMCGYQCEIDPSPRAWSGGIYYEGGRGWLYPIKNPAAQKAFHVDKWNEIVVRAVGNKIKTWVNGVRCADLADSSDKEGFFALQMHPGKEGKILWRKIRVKELQSKGNPNSTDLSKQQGKSP